MNRQTSRRNLENLGDQSLSDILHIFVESHVHQSQENMELFKPLDFSQIACAPHAILKDAIKKLPRFEGNNATTAKTHLQKFERHLVSYCDDVSSNHEDIKMNLFALSLEDDAAEWYENLGDDSYKTLSDFLEGFKKKWGGKKEPRHLLVSLQT